MQGSFNQPVGIARKTDILVGNARSSLVISHTHHNNNTPQPDRVNQTTSRFSVSRTDHLPVTALIIDPLPVTVIQATLPNQELTIASHRTKADITNHKATSSHITNHKATSARITNPKTTADTPIHSMIVHGPLQRIITNRRARLDKLDSQCPSMCRPIARVVSSGRDGWSSPQTVLKHSRRR